MRTSDALLYTPSGEHFGIVPIEAMYVGTPVIAVNDGAGPTETVQDGKTGFLCKSDEIAFAEAAVKLLTDRSLQKQLGEAGRKRVEDEFSFQSFATQLDKVVKEK